ncbi:MAG: carboxypeptidase regulatory-like domain-containing protein [Acidobacteriota bacterium]
MKVSPQVLSSCFRGLGLALLLLALVAVPAFPQATNGSVRGTVQDQTKAVIPGANVTLTNTATNIQFKTTTNNVGIYVFPAVPAGPYKLAAEFSGMAPFEGALTVRVAESATVDVVLSTATTTTSITVQDVTPLVTADSQSLGHVLERTRIEQLPINGRNVMNLLATVPGMTSDANGAWRVYGTRVGTFDVVLDGAALTDQLYGSGSMTRMPSLDSIQEFHVENNAASAKYQRQGNIVLSTKSGTNDIHGTAYETNRDYGYGQARARDNFSNKPAKYIRNEFGATVGGPVWIPKVYNGKNKTFFFFNYEGYKTRQGPYNNYRVPTVAMKNGDFSGLTDSVGTPQILYDPLSTQADGSRIPFSYNGKLNAIDPSRISPVAKYIYSVLPDPTNSANPLMATNFNAAAPIIENQYTWGAKFDHRFSDKDLVYGRITKSMASSYRPASAGVPTLGGFGNSNTRTYPNESLSFDWTRSFTPTFFNDFMFSASRTVTTQFSGDFTRYYSTELGLPNPGHQPGYPVINNIGVGTGNGNYFQPANWNMQYFNYFIMEDNATKLKGKHEFQFGFHFRYDQLTYMPQQQRTAGAVTFVPVTTALYDPSRSTPNQRRAVPNTGNVAGAFYLGYANYEVRQSKGKYYMHQNEDALYFQDTFRVTPRLTLNLGVRWQFSPYPNDKYYIMSAFDTSDMSVVLGNSLDTFYKVGAANPALIKTMEGYGVKFKTYKEAGLPQKLVYDNWHDIGPRLGFAYRALEGRKSFVLRGGYALSYNLIPIYGWNDRMRMNMPFFGQYQNYTLTDSATSPDGINNWGLVNIPTIVAGQNSADAVTFDRPLGIYPGSDSLQIAWFDPHQPTSRVHDWNLTAEKELMADTVLKVSYVGNHATHQDSYDDLNQMMPDYTWVATTGTMPLSGSDYYTKTRPYGTNSPYANLQLYGKNGWGWSNGITAEVERRFAKGYGYQFMYMMMNTNKAASHGWYGDSQLSPVSSFLPGTVPTDHHERMRLLQYMRDTTIPQHEIRGNFIVDLPFGKGKPVLRNANSIVNGIVGGWQVTGMGRWKTNWFSLPTTNWPTGTPFEYYGHKYPIQDCRSGQCRPGYLMWNGYIPAHQINSVDANGKPNGVMGVPANYQASYAPLWPYPANYRSLNAGNDPNYGYYGSNTVWLPVSDDTKPYEIGQDGNTMGSPLSPWINQAVLAPSNWTIDSSLFKSFNMGTERVKLRVQLDFFNVLNVPGNPWGAGADGIVSTYSGANTPRMMQASARLSW